MKSRNSFRALGLVSVICAAVLAACGGGGDEVNFVIPTAIPTGSASPTATSTPVGTATNTPVPTNTNTPVGTATNTPVPTNTNTPVATATNTPVPTNTNTPVGTATNTPVPTNTDTPVATATNTPVPTNTDTPVATATNTPVPTNTDTPVPTNTDTPVPTSTNTPAPTATPLANSCAPGVPLNGQVVKVAMLGEDKQGDDNGQAIYPNLSSDITYTFNAGAGTYSTAVSNPLYVTNPNGTYSPATGDILSSETPLLPDPANDSFLSLTPPDWAQRLAKQLGTQSVGSVATLPVTFEARGFLPGLLAQVLGGTSPDPQNELIQNQFIAKATRLNDGAVNGVNNACNFSFTLYRNFQFDPAVILTAGNHGDSTNPLMPTQLDEDAALQNISIAGAVLGGFSSDRGVMLYLEPYMPALSGTFSTSSQVPFVPVALKWTHVYGISSLSFPVYSNTDGAGNQRVVNERAVSTASAAAFQQFTYVP